MKVTAGLGLVLKGLRTPLTEKVMVTPAAHSGEVVHAFCSVTVLTYVASEVSALDVHAVVVEPTLQVTGFAPS